MGNCCKTTPHKGEISSNGKESQILFILLIKTMNIKHFLSNYEGFCHAIYKCK